MKMPKCVCPFRRNCCISFGRTQAIMTPGTSTPQRLKPASNGIESTQFSIESAANRHRTGVEPAANQHRLGIKPDSRAQDCKVPALSGHRTSTDPTSNQNRAGNDWHRVSIESAIELAWTSIDLTSKKRQGGFEAGSKKGRESSRNV